MVSFMIFQHFNDTSTTETFTIFQSGRHAHTHSQTQV
jgi:hypothetical protein